MNKKLSSGIAVFLLVLTLLAGCSTASNKTDKDSTSQDKKKSTSVADKQDEKAAREKANKELISDIVESAKQGKIINCEFPVRTTNFGDVENTWGKADQTSWVPAAKGTYSTYSKKNVAFGWNKGMAIFEVRSFDSRLKNITLADLKQSLGTPAYDTKANDQQIIGYTTGTDYKLLFVLAQTTDVNTNPVLDHYSVFDPRGTVNSMADDPGREW